MGRRDTAISGRISGEEKALARAAAERRGYETLSRWVRAVVLKEIRAEFGEGVLSSTGNGDEGR